MRQIYVVAKHTATCSARSPSKGGLLGGLRGWPRGNAPRECAASRGPEFAFEGGLAKLAPGERAAGADERRAEVDDALILVLVIVVLPELALGLHN